MGRVCISKFDIFTVSRILYFGIASEISIFAKKTSLFYIEIILLECVLCLPVYSEDLNNGDYCLWVPLFFCHGLGLRLSLLNSPRYDLSLISWDFLSDLLC